MVELFRDKIPKIKDIEDLEYLFNFLENKTEKNADEVLSILNSPSGFSLLRAKNMTGNHYKEIWKIINDQYNKLTDEKLIYKAPSFWEKFVKQKTLADFKRFLKFPSCREDNGLKNLICFTKEVSKNLDENKKRN